MSTENNPLILAFTGTETTARVLKGMLETGDIYAIIKSETEAARISGFGSPDRAGVYILQSDLEKAKPFIAEFSKRNL